MSRRAVPQIQIDVFRTDEHGRRERMVYALPAECSLIVVDADGLFGTVWGFIGGTDDNPGPQVDATPLGRHDGTLLA